MMKQEHAAAGELVAEQVTVCGREVLEAKFHVAREAEARGSEHLGGSLGVARIPEVYRFCR